MPTNNNITKNKKRMRGGQPGNLNAFRHGFYSRHFENDELKDLDAFLMEGLSEEIALMRVTARRMIQLASEVESIEDQINILGAVGLAATRLAGMLKVKKLIGADEEEVTGAVSEALAEALKKWNRD